ncbi:related to high-affinity glucose transporter [Phialocephala subalpina]|uniref:Related to high-affinity glucose transporter n=1 Tax=Phialocephala subalpina TaxID=576137 RepID=A0A1L7WY36_9HELO|nr:related to high-affinity glucose transporter [Phialocephala subalpina]
MGYTTPKINNVYFLAAISTMGGMLFGFDISSMSAIIGTSQYVDYFNNPQGIVQGGIGSALAGGSVIGAMMAGPVSNRMGRRDSIMFACFWWLLGTSLQAGCNGIPMLIIGRFVNGICIGITSSQVPVYLAEIAKKESRGSIIVIQQWSIEWGIFIMYFVGYGCKFITTTPTASFRTAWAIQLVPCFILIIGLPFLHESPRWLAKVGREKECIAVLADIQAKGNIDDPLVVAEWEEISTVLAAEREGQKGWKRFVKNSMWKRTFAGVSVQAWQQLSGANVMMYYVVYIFDMAGMTGNVGLTSSGVQYAVFIIGTFFTFFFIDKTGRRPLLIYGALAMGICHFIVGGVMGTYGVYLPDGLDGNLSVRIKVTGPPAYTVIAFVYILVLVYALTLAPIAWVYAAEIWSLETRADGMSLASIANWLFNFAIGLFLPSAFQNISWKIFIIFGVLCIGASAQAFLSYPETAGKTLEEVEHSFQKGAPWPWHTKPGGSGLDAKVVQAREQGLKISNVLGADEEMAEYREHVHQVERTIT